ncbi:hypothetical protein M422DRAFT_175439 [Sphaerobolus stellatus SS14]|uniref:Uncharacterized protein n=1 Tax=Sphaerobolus stellatus (strain SS14) TaxID=990650 RepID=A0A0C9U8A1_SPHS4|nr:hypothetical protein M422DRAFT_175439 [Sphaerobolus stellatus SS14]
MVVYCWTLWSTLFEYFPPARSNYLSEKYLNQKKEGMDMDKIPILQEGSSEDRKQLAVYCSKDAYLPQQLLDKLDGLTNEVRRAQQLCMPWNIFLWRAAEKDRNRSLQKIVKQGRILG